MPGFNFFDTQECEWADMEVAIEGADVVKIRGVRYGIETDASHLHAKGRKPISIQRGNDKPTGELRLLKSALDALNDAAKTAGVKNILGLPFDVTISYVPKDSNGQLRVDTLVGCKVTKYEKGWEQGAQQMEITLPILFLDLVEG